VIRLVVANVANKAKAVHQVAAHGDYAMMNEVRDQAIGALADLQHAGWRAYLPKSGARQNSHLWDPRQVGVVARGQRLLMVGGHKGNGKNRRDKRRRGPSRFETHQVVYDFDGRGMVTLIDLHLAAKASTTARWRMPLVLASLVRARASAAALRARYPGVPQVMAGDGNLPRLGSWRMGKSWHVVQTPADFGRRHYTQVYYRGPITVTLVKEVHTASDHDALVLDLDTDHAPRFGGLA